MDVPPNVPISELYLQCQKFPLLLKLWGGGAGGVFPQPWWMAALVCPLLQMIMWPVVLSGLVGNVVNVIANSVFLYVFHLGIV